MRRNPPSPLARFGLQRRARRLALPTMNAAATDARVVVAGVAPFPRTSRRHQAITTTFDVTLVRAVRRDSPTTFRASRTRRRRTIATSSRRAVRTALWRERRFCRHSARLFRRFRVERRCPQQGSPRAARKRHDNRNRARLRRQRRNRSSIERYPQRAAGDQGHGSVAGRPAHRRRCGTLYGGAAFGEHGSLPRQFTHAIASTCPEDGGETSTTPNTNGGYTPFQFAQLYGLASLWRAT